MRALVLAHAHNHTHTHTHTHANDTHIYTYIHTVTHTHAHAHKHIDTLQRTLAAQFTLCVAGLSTGICEGASTFWGVTNYKKSKGGGKLNRDRSVRILFSP